MSIIAKAEEFIVRGEYSAAESALTEALIVHPSDPDTNALLAKLWLCSQREQDALEALERATNSSLFEEVAQLALDHFSCRAAMAAKIGVTDPVGSDALSRLAEIFSGQVSPDVGIGLSACLIVKNEESQLARCLESLKGVADEIIVVDTGSTDRTLEIAKQYGAKIGHFAWCEDFAKARNAALELATQPWCLWIDADEELTANSVNMLREGLMRPQFGGYFIQIVNMLGTGTEGETYVHAPLRLFRRHEKVRFIGRIHEQIVQGISDLGWRSATLNNVYLNHYGYTTEMMTSRDKLERTLRLLNLSIEEEPEFAFHHFNLAMAHSVARHWREAESAARNAIALMPERAAYEVSAHHLLVASLLNRGDYLAAISAARNAESLGLGCLHIDYELARALLEAGELDEAKSVIDRTCERDWPENFTGDYGVFTFKRWVLKGRIYASLGHFEEALTALDEALKANPKLSDAHGVRGTVLFKLSRFDEARSSFETCLGNPSDRNEATRMLAYCEAEAGNFVAACDYWMQLNAQGLADAGAWQLAARQSMSLQLIEEAYRLTQPKFSDPVTHTTDFALACLQSGHPQVAVQILTPLLQKHPSYANGWFSLGDALYCMGAYLPAAQAFEHGLQHEPFNAAGWLTLGNSLAQMNQDSAAAVAYRQALDLDPKCEAAKKNLAQMTDSAA